MRANELLEGGDLEGEAVWLKIAEAIEKLLAKERPDDAEVHYAPPIGGVFFTQYAAATGRLIMVGATFRLPRSPSGA